MRAPPNALLAAMAAIPLTLFGAGCSRHRATDADCAEILDRIVELELAERGFRDPALVELKKDELHRVLAPDVKQCQGRALPTGALACVRAARSVEEISHRCLK
jgi:hypothetical protein